MFFITISALHVSGDFSAHHQELKTCVCSLRYCHAFLLSTAAVVVLCWNVGTTQHNHTSGRQQESMTIPKAAHTGFKLLMMGGKIARNM